MGEHSLMDINRLIKDCLKGNPSAQKQLYDHFAPLMLSVCYRYTKSIEDAEDVLQEGFIKVFFKLSQYQTKGELGGWIRRIMATTAINFLRKKNLAKANLFDFDDELPIIESEADPELKMEAKEIADLIRQLPLGYQTIFNLYAVEGYSHTEIAEMLGINEGTSRSQYARARAQLVQWVEQRNNDVKMTMYER
jgi:RNA polymerase sigma factor (sigma-70 family)